MQGQNKTLTLKDIRARKETHRIIASGRYLLKGQARQGGIASVYRAYDSIEERHVAVKLFRASYERDDIVEESFRRETQALSDLRHPNIVEILDSGIEESTGEHFIVMEWIDEDLDVYLSRARFKDWPDFYRSVGRFVLEALAFAHTHSTIHRDIKPSNVLITSDGVAKVCDFGISKIRNFLEPGVTLAQYASIPYAPPEHDDGSYSYSRDVFGFAALCVSVLSSKPPKDHAELLHKLDGIGLDAATNRLFRRCLSLDAPVDRPATAAVLLSEFERLVPKPKAERQGVILLALTKKVRDILAIDIGAQDEASAQRFVSNDLTDARIVLEDQGTRPSDSERPSAPSFRIYGTRYGYIGIPAAPTSDKLLLISALEFSASQLEEKRDDAYEAAFTFSFSGSAPATSNVNIKRLIEVLTEFAADKKAELVERRRHALYSTWLNLLNAKTELERQRKRHVRYARLEFSGTAVRFFLTSDSDIASIDEQDVRIDILRDVEFTGTVVSVGDDSVLVVPGDRNIVDLNELPESGSLHIDTAKAEAAIDKQKTALECVRYGRAVNPSLGAFVVSPDAVPTTHPVAVEFIQRDIDDDKKDAVMMALGQPDLMLVQGPPGTGKTTLITELVLQTLRRDPESRILLTSQTHVALDNSLERITAMGNGSVRAVRIGHEDDERIAPRIRPLLLDNQLPALKRSAISAGRQFLQDWASQNGVDMNFVRMAMALEHYASLKDRLAQIASRIDELRPLLSESNTAALDADERVDLVQELGERMRERDVLAKDVAESYGELRKYETDRETLEHFKHCSTADLRSWASTYAPNTPAADQLRKLLVAHFDWESRFGRSREFRAALVASSQVVAGTCLGVMSIPGRQEIQYDLCIVDEASIATPTEVLVPMSRARRTVLVGDSHQLSPFQDPELSTRGLLAQFNLTPHDQRTTLFNHLAQQLPDELKKSLTTQHRMVPAIGNLISECFYDRALKSVDRNATRILTNTMKRPVVWFSTSKLPNRGSRKVGTSYNNDFEVAQITALLGRASFELTGRKASPISVAVLTGYGAQKDRLQAAIAAKRAEWSGFREVYVNVVDAFQGREADMLIFSITRSDSGGLGFLREMERINVALSRGREYLAIVGDHLFCQEADSKKNPLKDVLDYVRGHPDDCLLHEVTP